MNGIKYHRKVGLIVGIYSCLNILWNQIYILAKRRKLLEDTSRSILLSILREKILSRINAEGKNFAFSFEMRQRYLLVPIIYNIWLLAFRGVQYTEINIIRIFRQEINVSIFREYNYVHKTFKIKWKSVNKIIVILKTVARYKSIYKTHL